MVRAGGSRDGPEDAVPFGSKNAQARMTWRLVLMCRLKSALEGVGRGILSPRPSSESEFGDPQAELAKGRVRTLHNVLQHKVTPSRQGTGVVPSPPSASGDRWHVE